MPDITIDEFRAEATAFLDANARPREVEQKFVWGEGSDEVSLFEEISREREQAAIAKAKEWRAKRFDAGFGWISGPAEYGGRELPALVRTALPRARGALRPPRHQSFFGIGLGMVAPTILAHATDTVRDAYLTQALPGRSRRLPALQRARRRLGPGRPADRGRP